MTEADLTKSETEKVEMPIDYQSFDRMIMTLNTRYSTTYEITGVSDNGEFLNIKYKLSGKDVSVIVKKDMITRENNGYKITSPVPFAGTGTTELILSPKS